MAKDDSLGAYNIFDLREAAKGRADNVPLLVQSDGSPWGENPGQRYHRHIDKIVTEIGLDPDVDDLCLAALKHCSDATAEHSDPASGIAAQHIGQHDRTDLLEAHRRAQRRHLAQGAAAARRAADSCRRQCHCLGELIDPSSSNRSIAIG